MRRTVLAELRSIAVMRTILSRQDLVTLVNQLEELVLYRLAELKTIRSRRPPLWSGTLRSESGPAHGPRRSMMSLRTAAGAGRPRLLRRRVCGDGGAAVVACAAAMPLIVFAVAVAVDYANVARFTTRVQLAADAAAAAVSKTIARNPNVDGRDVDQVAERIAAFVFARKPRGAPAGRRRLQQRAAPPSSDDGRLSGCGAEQFRLRARLWRDQRQRFGDVARASRRFPSDPRS